MDKYTHFRCMGCKTVWPVGEYVNNWSWGWKRDGSPVRVDNKCCSDCGSNDLVYLPADSVFIPLAA